MLIMGKAHMLNLDNLLVCLHTHYSRNILCASAGPNNQPCEIP